MIRVNDVYIDYRLRTKTIEAVRGVTLDINDGDYVALVGPAGSGKSTLMSAIAGLLFPRSGDLSRQVQFEESVTWSRAKIRAQNYGIIFQFSEMANRFTVQENLLMSWKARWRGDRDHFNQRLEHLCASLEMFDLLDYHPARLSGGQRQKAAIANALIKDAPTLLADEPSGDLDPQSLDKLQKLFKEEHDKGKTIILITHDMDLAFDAKTIFEIKDGQVSNVLK